MQNLNQITPKAIKALFPAERFYPIFLNGSFGKHTGDGWQAWNGLCPFHNDRSTGSFYINKKNGAFKCFSCGASGGDIFDFHMMFNGFAFKESFKALKEVCHA